eukprot:2400035-Prymnesium_polylepis.1
MPLRCGLRLWSGVHVCLLCSAVCAVLGAVLMREAGCALLCVRVRCSGERELARTPRVLCGCARVRCCWLMRSNGGICIWYNTEVLL